MSRLSAVLPVREDSLPDGEVEGEDHNEQNFSDYQGRVINNVRITEDRQQYD